MYKMKPDSSKGYLRACQIFYAKEMFDAAAKILNIGMKRVSPSDPNHKRLAALKGELENHKKPKTEKAVDAKPAQQPTTQKGNDPLLLPLRERCKCLRLSKTFRHFASCDSLLWTAVDAGEDGFRLNDKALVGLLGRGGRAMQELNILRGSKLTRTILRPLVAAKCRLRSVALTENNKINPVDLVNALVACGGSSLETLNLSSSNVVDAAAKIIVGKFNALKHLVLSRCSLLTDDCFNGVTVVSALESLDISFTSIGNKGMASLVPTFANSLRSLDVSGCASISDQSVALWRKLELLEVLRFSRTNSASNRLAFENSLLHPRRRVLPCFSASCLQALSGLCRNLEEISLSNCAGVSDDAVALLAKRCKNLKRVRLGGCPGVSDTGFGALIASAAELSLLDASNNSRITDGLLFVIAAEGGSLEELYLSNTPNITGQGLVAMAELKDCKVLNVDFCTGMRNEQAKRLKELLPKTMVHTRLS
ncbi:hypothetical protein DFJ73DRAFT_832445 [Zopfochytrium polystomum]|nr:hypothetical protein DFJ73DRAFT_832445 [Zopfochytrium polystomum]